MPANVEWLPKSEILNFDEIERLARIFVNEGVNQIRLTGGEPLVRRDLHKLIARLCSVQGIQDISLTTNGYFLPEQAQQIYDSGIRRINISLDSLRPDRFLQITRNDSYAKVMNGIQSAKRAGFHPIKINCVAIRGFNDDEIVDFLRWGRENDLQIRFIEFMPLDGDHKWTRANVLTKAEILEKAASFDRLQEVAPDLPAPATKYACGGGEFGVIPSVTEPFCANCTRIRLTADGKFRTCLFAIEETDLRGPLRSGRTDEELVLILREAVLHKWAGHKINDPDFVPPPRAMYAIGG
jgi:cyclic pyranopterin phosphate synthase